MLITKRSYDFRHQEEETAILLEIIKKAKSLGKLKVRRTATDCVNMLQDLGRLIRVVLV